MFFTFEKKYITIINRQSLYQNTAKLCNSEEKSLVGLTPGKSKQEQEMEILHNSDSLCRERLFALKIGLD